MDSIGFSMVMAVFVFLVMIIFMVAPNTGQRGVGLDLPKSHYAVAVPHAARGDAMVIALTRDGKIYLGSNAVELGQLGALIPEALANGAERKAYLKADQNVRYADVLKVMDKVHSAGMERVCFLLESVTPKQPIPQGSLLAGSELLAGKVGAMSRLRAREPGTASFAETQ